MFAYITIEGAINKRQEFKMDSSTTPSPLAILSAGLAYALPPIAQPAPADVVSVLNRFGSEIKLGPFFEKVRTQIMESRIVPDMQSGSLHNMYALSVVFSGMEQAKELSLVFRHSINHNVGLLIEDNKKKVHSISIELVDLVSCEYQWQLFLGASVINFSSETHEAFKEYLKVWLVKNKVTKLGKFQQNLHRLDFDFNRPVFSKLRLSINENGHNLGQKVSFVYFLNIKPTESESTVVHSFVVEQSFPNRFRLFQGFNCSFIEDLKRRKYGEPDEQSWNRDQMGVFLNNLTAYLSGVKDPARLAQLQFDLFGVHEPVEEMPKYLFNQRTGELRAYRLQYLCHQFNPDDCAANLDGFLNA